MSKLTYRDTPLIQTAGAELSATRTAWWLTDKHGVDWYIHENDDNQYLAFREFDPFSPPRGMTREEFAELFE